MAAGIGSEWEEKLKKLEGEIACYRQRREELTEILQRIERAQDRLSPPTRGAAPEDKSPLPEGGGPTSPDGGGESGPTGPDGSGEGEGPPPPRPGWKQKWRQDILEGHPQARLKRLETAFSLVGTQLQQAEGALEAACSFIYEIAGRLKTTSGVPPSLARDLIGSEPFQRLAAHLLAELLRKETTLAHPQRNSILCSKPTPPRATSLGKEGVAVKTKEPDLFWWWILIILLIFLLFFVFVPAGGAAGQ